MRIARIRRRFRQAQRTNDSIRNLLRERPACGALDHLSQCPKRVPVVSISRTWRLIGGVGQQVPHSHRLASSDADAKARDGIVQTDSSLLDKLQQDGRAIGLGHGDQVINRVGPCGDGLLLVGQTEAACPDDPVRLRDGSRHSWNPKPATQRLQLAPEVQQRFNANLTDIRFARSEPSGRDENDGSNADPGQDSRSRHRQATSHAIKNRA